MCFSVHQNHRQPKTAKRDIVCYKTLLKGNVSVIQDFKYRIGKRYVLADGLADGLHVTVNLSLSMGGDIAVGFHSYSSMRKTKAHVSRMKLPYRCVIPKGSTYYFNPSRHEYVSDSIKIVSKMCMVFKK